MQDQILRVGGSPGHSPVNGSVDNPFLHPCRAPLTLAQIVQNDVKCCLAIKPHF